MRCLISAKSVSVIIPTFNGASRISGCLESLQNQTVGSGFEVLVVDDGSTDATAEVVESFPGVRLVRQANAGPAAARNLGASKAEGEIVLFTDDDCVPTPDWVEKMLAPFQDPQVVGAKGTYRSRQQRLAARFVQIEYEDRYRLMAKLPSIDFIDTYSAGFRLENFLEMGGYDTSFPVACAEDVELSYRMSARGWLMRYVPGAIVYHSHPDAFWKYLKKKYKFAYWRVLAVRKNPVKATKDSHTPQIMKLQLLFPPLFLAAAIFELVGRPAVPTTAAVVTLFILSTIPFAARAFRKDPIIGLLSPLVLAARAFAQFLGVVDGLFRARQKPLKLVDVHPA